MTGDRYMYYWSRNDEWWDYDENGVPVVLPTAPEEAQKSYRYYLTRKQERCRRCGPENTSGGTGELNVKKEDRDFLADYIKSIDDLIRSGDVNELLLAIDDAILEYGYDESRDNLTDVGRKLEYIYDEIYENN